MALIARERELTQLDDLLRRHRLVTVVGVGGIGKTTLARAAAGQARERYERGVSTIDLTRVEDTAAIDEFIASQLGHPGFGSLLGSPDNRTLLIVVDNCEHVLEPAAEAVEAVLGSGLNLSVLATSRSPLDLPDEVLLPLAPLDVPPIGLSGDDAGAVRMFVERARQLGGEVRSDDTEVVAEICRRLDGVPLALELAAAQVRTSPLTRILDGLAARPAELSRRRFRGRGAHRSVGAVVDWSLELLDDDARSTFEQLAVIAGPFDAAMAGAVAALDSPRIEALLDDLVAASLVSTDGVRDDVRFRLLHPVRAVALDHLGRVDGAVDAAQSRAAEHVVGQATRILLGSEAEWSVHLPRLLDLYDSMIATQRWMLDHDEEPDRSLILLAVFWAVIQQLHRAEVAEVGERVLRRWNDPTAPFWPDAAATVATCYNLLGRYDDAIDLATRALDHADQSDFAPVTLRRALAQTTRRLGRREEACRWFGAGAVAAESSAVPGLAMVLRVDEAILVSELGDPDRAEGMIAAVADQAERSGADINRAWARCGTATVRWHRNAADAVAVTRDAIELSQRSGYPAGELFALRLLGAVQLDRHDLAAAASAVLELQEALLERHAVLDLRAVLDHAARILELRGDDAWADLAATAATLDTTSTLTARAASDVVERGLATGRVLPLRDAFGLCRERLGAVAGSRGAAATDAHTEADPALDRTPTSSGNSLVLEGDTWRWTYAGSSVVIKASKGMNDLARLVAEPGREMSALDLMGSTKAADDAIPTLDSEARSDIEHRIRELQDDLDDAERNHDLQRAERAAVEMDVLIDHLTAAVGLGGRSRRTGTDPERARSAVTQRIRSTIKRIDRLHPKLGGHLSVSLHTGIFCSYRPPEPTDWLIER